MISTGEGAAVLEVGDPNLAAQGKVAMGGREVVLIEALAAGRQATVKTRPVPGSDPGLAEGDIAGTASGEIGVAVAGEKQHRGQYQQ